MPLPRRDRSRRTHVASRKCLAWALALTACETRKSAPPEESAKPDAHVESAPTKEIVTMDPARNLERCLSVHEGILLDLGEPGMPTTGAEPVAHEGASWARVREREINLPFLVTAEEASMSLRRVVVRGRLEAARFVEVRLNGKKLANLVASKDGTETLRSELHDALLVPGKNEISLRFGHRSKTVSAPLAEFDWILLGTGESMDPGYAAPTRADLLGQVRLGTEPKAAIALRAPSFLRCSGWIAPHAKLSFSIGLTAPGEAALSVRWLMDREPARELLRTSIRDTSWRPFEFALDDSVGGPGAIEFRTDSISRGARLAIGEPKVASLAPSDSTSSPQPARGVVLVVLGHVDPKSLRLFGGEIEMPFLDGLATRASIFEEHRARTTFSSGSIASLFAGRSARALRMIDGDSLFPKAALSIQRAMSEAGLVTGYFTANPSTGHVFGFDQGWSTFAEIPLTSASVEVLDRGAEFLRAHASERFFLALHARGGHPPWDVSTESLRSMPPAEYAGGIDPRHAGEIFARARHTPPLIRITDADRIRALALYRHSLGLHDQALGKLLDTLRATGRDKDTLVIVTSDVGPNLGAIAPFAEGDPPSEASLRIPLIVQWPGSLGTRTKAPTSSDDVAPTMLRALGLVPPKEFSGRDLHGALAHPELWRALPMAASTSSRTVTRWGTFVFAQSKSGTKLCDLSLEAECVTNLASTHPIAFEVLERASDLEMESDRLSGLRREPAAIGAKEVLDLMLWGRSEE